MCQECGAILELDQDLALVVAKDTAHPDFDFAKAQQRRIRAARGWKTV